MSTEIVGATSGGVPAILQGNWAFEGDASDILIPKILLGQSTSKAVQAEKVAFGQLYKSTTFDVVGGRDKPVEIIPLYHSKTWVISAKAKGASKFEYQRQEPFTAANRDRLWQDADASGTEWKNEQCLNFFVLIPTEIEADLSARKLVAETGELPDTEASLLPCALSFKSTSYVAGKALVTHFAKAADFNMPPFVTTFVLTTEKTSNDRGTFYILKVERGHKTSPAHLEACAKWRQIVAKQPVKIDDSDLAGHAEATHSKASDDEMVF